MKKIAIIGAGISGLSTAHFLKEKYKIKVFEKESSPGGLIRCKRINGNLFHLCGGHVFNSKRQDVLDWFWNVFDRTNEFTKADRNSVVFMGNGMKIPYPIENHMYLFDTDIQQQFIKDLIQIVSEEKTKPANFEEFLRQRFGNLLYDIYFLPYNRKIWKCDLSKIPLKWLEGKLPMPTVEEIIFNNMNHVEEKSFVHSSFWYEKDGGSQFIADKLSQNLDITYNCPIQKLTFHSGKWIVNEEEFDKVIYCGNIKKIPSILDNIDVNANATEYIESLKYHGTTTVFCQIDSNPYSWIYLPGSEYDSHRIICTGNFSESNNSPNVMTGTIEFTDYIALEDIISQLKTIPLHPQYISHQYNQYTYPIQDNETREFIKNLKNDFEKYGLFMTGRFIDWEYYNMDTAIGAAMDMCKKI